MLTKPDKEGSFNRGHSSSILIALRQKNNGHNGDEEIKHQDNIHTTKDSCLDSKISIPLEGQVMSSIPCNRIEQYELVETNLKLKEQ